MPEVPVSAPVVPPVPIRSVPPSTVAGPAKLLVPERASVPPVSEMPPAPVIGAAKPPP